MMSKKITILIVSIVAIIIVIVFGFWYFSGEKSSPKTFGDLNPFGLPADRGNGGRTKNNRGDILGKDIKAKRPKLFQITNLPISGAVFLEMVKKTTIDKSATTTKKSSTSDKNATTTEEFIVRYMDKASGNIYEFNSETMSKKRVSNTTIPRVHKTIFGKNGENLLARYINNDTGDIETYYATIVKKDENKDSGALEGSFLQKNIEELAMSPDREKVFYLYNTKNSVVGTKSDINGGNSASIFSFSFREWLPQWVGNKIYLTTKPSSKVPGYLYSIGVNKKSMNKIFGGINGLTTLSNSKGDVILYSESSRNGFSTKIYRKKDKKKDATPFITFPEKCVWSEDDVTIYCGVPLFLERGEYPDEWYQGIVSFSDGFWSLDTKTGSFDFMVDPIDYNAEIDAIDLFLDSKENYLFFTNKKDMTLWVLDIQNTTNNQ